VQKSRLLSFDLVTDQLADPRVPNVGHDFCDTHAGAIARVVGSLGVPRDTRGTRDAGLHVLAERERNEVGGLPLREIALALWADLRMVRAMKTPGRNTDRLGEEFAGLQRCASAARGLSRPSGRSIGAATYS